MSAKAKVEGHAWGEQGKVLIYRQSSDLLKYLKLAKTGSETTRIKIMMLFVGHGNTTKALAPLESSFNSSKLQHTIVLV